jgi:hypothetical protein
LGEGGARVNKFESEVNDIMMSGDLRSTTTFPTLASDNDRPFSMAMLVNLCDSIEKQEPINIFVNKRLKESDGFNKIIEGYTFIGYKYVHMYLPDIYLVDSDFMPRDENGQPSELFTLPVPDKISFEMPVLRNTYKDWYSKDKQQTTKG